MAPSQCWHMIIKVQSHQSEGYFARDTSAIKHWNNLEIYLSKLLFKAPRGQWVEIMPYPSAELQAMPGPVFVSCTLKSWSNSSPPGQNGRLFADDIFRCIFVNEQFCFFIKISLKFVPKSPIDNNPALVKIMAWHRIGDKPLSEPMLTYFHWRIYVALWGKELKNPLEFKYLPDKSWNLI